MNDFSGLTRRDFIGASGALMAFAAGFAPRPAGAAAAFYGKTRDAAAAAVEDIL